MEVVGRGIERLTEDVRRRAFLVDGMGGALAHPDAGSYGRERRVCAESQSAGGGGGRR